MIRYALLLSILAHFILISGLSGPNVNIDNAFERDTSSSDVSNVLQVRLSSVKQMQVVRSSVQMVDPATIKSDSSQKVALRAKDEVVRPVSGKRQSGANKMPLLMAGMLEAANIQDKDVAFDSYFKSADVDMSVIPLHELKLNNDQPNSLIGITWHLRIFVDQHGLVKKVLNLEGAQPVDYGELVIGVEKMQFIPAKKNGVAVNSYIDVALEVAN